MPSALGTPYLHYEYFSHYEPHNDAPSVSVQALTFDTSRVTTMGQMFYNAASFNQPLTFVQHHGQPLRHEPDVPRMFLGCS